MNAATDERPATARLNFIIAYVALVVGVDAFATAGLHWGFDWTMFRWSPPSHQDVDLFKLSFWLALPLAFSWRTLDGTWLGLARWQKIDGIWLAAVAGVGVLAVLLIPRHPELSRMYPGVGGLPAGAKWDFARSLLTWDLSWLPGWEFLLRYVLLRPVSLRWPRFGWLLVPLVEGLYHLQKPLPECGGSLLLSVILTRWALARRNVLLPAAAHLLIELDLIAVLVMI